MLQVEEKIVEELQSLGLMGTAEQAEPRMPEHADLAKLTYLSCVIKEAMRLHTVSFDSISILVDRTNKTCSHNRSH